jgi:hypothetical protein
MNAGVLLLYLHIKPHSVKMFYAHNQYKITVVAVNRT